MLVYAAVSGTLFLLLLLALIIALVFTPPKKDVPGQVYQLIRMILALAAGAFGAAIPGFFALKGTASNISISAGGALAVFVMVYLVNPPALIDKNSRSELKHLGTKLGPSVGESLESPDRDRS